MVSQLIANGRVAHPWLGAGLATIDQTVARADQGLPQQGVLVVKVEPGSPASKAGLQAATVRAGADAGGAAVPQGGDAIVAIDGKPVMTSAALADAVAAHKPGDRITLGIVRAGQHRDLQVIVGTAPSRASAP